MTKKLENIIFLFRMKSMEHINIWKICKNKDLQILPPSRFLVRAPEPILSRQSGFKVDVPPFKGSKSWFELSLLRTANFKRRQCGVDGRRQFIGRCSGPVLPDGGLAPAVEHRQSDDSSFFRSKVHDEWKPIGNDTTNVLVNRRVGRGLLSCGVHTSFDSAMNSTPRPGLWVSYHAAASMNSARAARRKVTDRLISRFASAQSPLS
jgi:hypothetical protein